MNSRVFLTFVAITVVVAGGAVWFLQIRPLPTTTTARPAQSPVEASPTPPPRTEGGDAALAPNAHADGSSAPRPAEAKPLAEWERKIDQVLNANAGVTETAQMLINLLPTLPREGQAEAAQHIANLIQDKEYGRVLPLLRNASLPEEVQDVLVTDLMNRDDTVKLPALLDVAKVPAHPYRDEALTDLQIFVDADYGQDWAKWDAAIKLYLRKQAQDNAPPPAAPLPAQ